MALSAAINNLELLRVCQLAIARLARFTSMDEHHVGQSFLCIEDNFCGVRFQSGSFQAQWMFGQDRIEFSRGDQIIDQMMIAEHETQSRRAA